MGEFSDAGSLRHIERDGFGSTAGGANFRHNAFGIGYSLGFETENAANALESTTIDLCLSVFPWAPFRSIKKFYGAPELAVLAYGN